MREPTTQQLAEAYGAMGCRGRHCAHSAACYAPRRAPQPLAIEYPSRMPDPLPPVRVSRQPRWDRG